MRSTSMLISLSDFDTLFWRTAEGGSAKQERSLFYPPERLRDLSILGQGVYLKVPRRQFICPHCGKYPTERLLWIELGKKVTKRYQEYLYERVKELTVEQVSKNENLSPEQVQKLFSQQAESKKKTGECRKD